jgi:hypothetical protein
MQSGHSQTHNAQRSWHSQLRTGALQPRQICFLVSQYVVLHVFTVRLDVKHLSWAHAANIHELRLHRNLESSELKALLAHCPQLYEQRCHFRAWLAANRVVPNQTLLTVKLIKRHILDHYKEVLAEKKVRKLLSLLCFDFGRLRDSYFEDRRKEPFVQAHLVRLIPVLKYFLDHPDLFLVWFGDGTFVWSNNAAPVGLRDQASPTGDRDHRPQAGVGTRLGLLPSCSDI